MSGLEVYSNTCLYFSTQKLYAIYVFKSVQCNPKRFLCTSVHFSVGRDVTTFLDEIFPGLWEERGGPTTWPPRSPDLTALDFFAWGFIKDVVYRKKSSRSGWFETTYHWSSWAYNSSHADKHVARAWISFRYLSSYNRCPHWSVRTCIKIFLSHSVHCWKHKLNKAFGY